ncbi:unnamed protein product [Mesocestoides corti]|uniref:Core Histone H2A/H2B/H3 domain-containing protein n=1 Tax=Mesocestoides corti TaxID=53468 RepID=A0A3P6IE67_MESCO|nr:unnamed protein product [Mesocestoides corti]
MGTPFDVNASAITGNVPPPYLDSRNLSAIFQQEHKAAQTEIPNLQDPVYCAYATWLCNQMPRSIRASFARAVRSIAQRTRIESALTLRWQASALDCLQEAAEAFLVDLFSYAALAAAHAKRVTVKPVDLHLVCRFIHFLQ